MGIDQIELTPEMIASLYPDSLLDENTSDPAVNRVEKKTEVSIPVPEYPFLGSNNQHICFITDQPDVEFLAEEQFNFLKKILFACKSSLEDIAVVNAAPALIHLSALSNQLLPRIIFLWGIQPESVGLTPDLPPFSISIWNQISIVPVHSMDLMIMDNPEGRELKKRLWNCLQKLFNL